jgi:hypothetical protein
MGYFEGTRVVTSGALRSGARSGSLHSSFDPQISTDLHRFFRGGNCDWRRVATSSREPTRLQASVAGEACASPPQPAVAAGAGLFNLEICENLWIKQDTRARPKRARYSDAFT